MQKSYVLEAGSGFGKKIIVAGATPKQVSLKPWFGTGSHTTANILSIITAIFYDLQFT